MNMRSGLLFAVIASASVPRAASAGGLVPEDIDYQLIGYLRMEGAMVSDDPEVAFVGRNDGFRLQNARLGIEGSYQERLHLRLTGDGAIDEREHPNAVEGTLRFALMDAYADLDLSRYATLRIARFKIYYDIEETTSPRERAFIDRALSSRGVYSTEGFEARGLGVKRNLGVALRSVDVLPSHDYAVGYEVAAQNGNGDLDTANDNDALALSAAIFADVRAMATVFVAGRFNRRTEGELPFHRTEDDISAAAGARVRIYPVTATAQLLARRTEFPTTGGPYENAWGAHAEAVVEIPAYPAIEAGYRYSILDPSDLISSDRVQEHTGGVNFLVEPYRMRLQLNYTHTIEQAGRVLDNDRVEALVEVAL